MTVQTPPIGEVRTLLPQHEALICASGVSPEVAAARGYWSARKKRELADLGFGESQRLVPALVIPVWDGTGNIGTYQIRPDRPRVNQDGKLVKYETPGKSRMVLDVPPFVREDLGNPRIPLFITEGARKADSAVSLGLCCISVLGVWNWRGTNEHGGKAALADWEYVARNGREVYLCFDSDVMTKPQVHAALARLKEFLEKHGANVRVIYLPPGPAAEKVGLDDYLAAGHSVADLLAHASSELRQPENNYEGEAAGPYRATEAGLVWMKPTQNGEAAVLLTNFAARIVGEVVQDDGAEERRLLEVEATRHGRVTSCHISPSELTAMNWPLEHLGAGAVVYAGFGVKDHVRAAIQLLSGETPERRVYGHTGWRKIGDAWCYLHAGGAIGPAGEVGGVSVDLPGSLSAFRLPSSPEGAELAEAVLASLSLLEMLPDAVSLPVLCAVYRAAMSTCDFALHLAGATGTGKSELAALAQQHWGPGLTARNLPGSWSSTSNALEALAFSAKDAIFVVDDFAPGGSTTDVNRMHREVDRLLRGQGNHSGRQRMRSDASLRPGKPPRGLILSTGEDVPKGESLRGRMLVLEMGAGTMNWNRLTVCQEVAARGQLAAAMAAFLKWMAGRYGTLVGIDGGLQQEVRELRSAAATSAMHKRTPEIVANLALGLRYFLSFAKEAGVLSEEEMATLWGRGWKALGEAASAHSCHQSAAEPTGLFLRLLGSAIASGRAHVAGPEGEAPPDPDAWGWRQDRQEWRPQSGLVGWVKGDDLYLEPDAAYATARSLGEATGEGIAITPRVMHKRLADRRLLASTDAGRGTHTVRKTLAGARREVLHLRAQSLLPLLETDQPDQMDGDEAEQPLTVPGGQFRGQVPELRLPETDHTNCPHEAPGNGNSAAVVGLGRLDSLAEEGAEPGPTSPTAPRPCYYCRETRSWRDALGTLHCPRCHPPADPSLVVEWIGDDGNGA